MDWIDCREEYPVPGEIVLGCDAISQYVSLAKRLTEEDDSAFSVMDIDKIPPDILITHWMRLPECAVYEEEDYAMD
jgi:hypothetical protein